MIGIDAGYETMAAYQSLGWPRFVVIDRDGQVKFHDFPKDDNLTELRQCLDTLLTDQTDPLPDGLVLKNGLCYPSAAYDAIAAQRDRCPRLAIGPNGQPAVVYYSNRNGSNAVYLRKHGEDGRFAESALTPDNLSDCYAPDCAFDSSGALWIVWCGNSGGQYDIYVQRLDSSGEPVTTQLTTSDDDAMAPRIAGGQQGNVTVTYYKWRKMKGVSRDRDIFARVYDPATRQWTQEVEISPHVPEVEDHTDPDLVVDAEGNSWIAWSYDYHPQLFDKPLDTDQPSVFAARLDARGSVAPPILVGTVGLNPTAIDLFPSLAFDDAGALWCAWDAALLGHPPRKIRLARQASPDKFDFVRDLSPSTVNCATPELSQGNDDSLIAAWSECADGLWRARIVTLKGGVPIAETVVEEAPADVLFPQAAQARDGRMWLAYEKCQENGSEVVLKELSDRMTPIHP